MSRDDTLSNDAPRSRTDRRREDTRRRLMKAAYESIARRGVEGLVIQDITEAADVGYGSFYNHFSTKDAIVNAVIDAARERSIEMYRSVWTDKTDFVESFASSLRICLRQSERENTWGWFIVRTSLSGGMCATGIAEQLQRTITAGLNDGYFTTDDVEMAHQAVIGVLLLGTIRIVSAPVGENYPDRLVATALKNLSVPSSRIDAALKKPLPDLSLVPFLEAS